MPAFFVVKLSKQANIIGKNVTRRPQKLKVITKYFTIFEAKL